MNKSIKIGIIVFSLIVVIVLVAFLLVNNSGGISSIGGGVLPVQEYVEKINVEEYKEQIEGIKYISNNGVLYEDDMIKIATFGDDDYEEYKEENNYPYDCSFLNEKIDINTIYMYNKTNEELEVDISRASINGYNLFAEINDSTISPGGCEAIDLDEINYPEEFIEAMGIGFLSDIELKIEFKDNEYDFDSSDNEIKIITLKTDFNKKAKKFDLPKSKVYDKDGIRIYVGSKYLSDPTNTLEYMKQTYSDYEHLKPQINPTVRLILVNDTNEIKEMKVKVRSTSKDMSEYKGYHGIEYFGYNTSISDSSITEIEPGIDYDFFDMQFPYIEKEEDSFNPNDIVYTFMIDGQDIFDIDFKDAVIK